MSDVINADDAKFNQAVADIEMMKRCIDRAYPNTRMHSRMLQSQLGV